MNMRSKQNNFIVVSLKSFIEAIPQLNLSMMIEKKVDSQTIAEWYQILSEYAVQNDIKFINLESYLGIWYVIFKLNDGSSTNDLSIAMNIDRRKGLPEKGVPDKKTYSINFVRFAYLLGFILGLTAAAIGYAITTSLN